MPKVVNARVIRADGSVLEVKLANLTSASVLIMTREPLLFRQPVTIAMFGVEVEAEIAFVISEPSLGAVASFVARPAVRELLEAHAGDVAAFGLSLSRASAEEERVSMLTAAGAPPHCVDISLSDFDAPSLDRDQLESLLLPGTAAAHGRLPSILPGVVPPAAVLADTTAEVPKPILTAQVAGNSLDLETVEDLRLDVETFVPRLLDHDQSIEHIDCPTPQNMPVVNVAQAATPTVVQPDLFGRPPLIAKKRPTKREDGPAAESGGGNNGAGTPALGARGIASERVAPDPAEQGRGQAADPEPVSRRGALTPGVPGSAPRRPRG